MHCSCEAAKAKTAGGGRGICTAVVKLLRPKQPGGDVCTAVVKLLRLKQPGGGCMHCGGEAVMAKRAKGGGMFSIINFYTSTIACILRTENEGYSSIIYN